MKTVLDSVLGHPSGNRCLTWLSRGEEQHMSFGEVAISAGRAAAGLAARGVRRGDIVMLVGTHHVDLYATWLGTTWLGAVPTIVAEPSVRIDQTIYWSRLMEQMRRIEARLIAIDPRIELDPAIPHVSYEVLVSSDLPVPARAQVTEDDLLLLQHSSGTTGSHKGVMLSNGAVMRHSTAYLSSLALKSDDIVASWLPLYHDMGLIACFVSPMVAGIPVVWLSPFEWVASPALLLKAIAKYRATLTWLPNFAYTFLAQRSRESNDLSSHRRAVINCSEPVTASAMDAFAQRFERDGLRRDALQSCYAMAENVFAVSATTVADPIRRTRIDGRVWRDEHRAVLPQVTASLICRMGARSMAATSS